MKRRFATNSKGFTLVELMVTLFLTAIAVVAIYRGYTSFSQSADAQQQVLEMQQNLRIGMYVMVKDIMRAGMKEEDSNMVAFSSANDAAMEFGMDLTGAEADGEDDDGDGVIDEPGERDGEDNDNDGDIDEEDEVRIGDGFFDDDGEIVRYNINGLNLQRQVWTCNPACAWGTAQTIITSVSALHFVYLDEDENILATPITDTTELNKIKTVEITLVARATNEDFRITNSETYTNQLGTWSWTAPGDNFRRRAMSMRVKVRNLNL